MEAEENLASPTLIIRKQNICQVHCYQDGSLFLSLLLSANKCYVWSSRSRKSVIKWQNLSDCSPLAPGNSELCSMPSAYLIPKMHLPYLLYS